MTKKFLQKTDALIVLSSSEPDQGLLSEIDMQLHVRDVELHDGAFIAETSGYSEEDGHIFQNLDNIVPVRPSPTPPTIGASGRVTRNEIIDAAPRLHTARPEVARVH